MPAHRHREEAINTQLALLLARYGVDAESETIQAGGRQRPDVLFALGGLRVILEGKFADVHDVEAVVLRDAQKRLESGICHLAVAIVYPPALRTTATAKLGEVLETAPLRVQVFAENGATDWTQATPAELLAILRRVQEQLVEVTARL